MLCAAAQQTGSALLNNLDNISHTNNDAYGVTGTWKYGVPFGKCFWLAKLARCHLGNIATELNILLNCWQLYGSPASHASVTSIRLGLSYNITEQLAQQSPVQ